MTADVAPRPLGEAFRADACKAIVASGGRVRSEFAPDEPFDAFYLPMGDRRRFGVLLNSADTDTRYVAAVALAHHLLAHGRFDIEVWVDGRPTRCEHHRADVLWALAFLHPAWSNAAIVSEYHRLIRQESPRPAHPRVSYHPAAGGGSAG